MPLLQVASIAFCLCFLRYVTGQNGAKLQVTNLADQAITVFWVNDGGDLVQLTQSINPRGDAIINTFAGHSFEIKFTDDERLSVPFIKANVDEHIGVKYDNDLGLLIAHLFEDEKQYHPEKSATSSSRSSRRTSRKKKENTPMTIQLTIVNNALSALEVFWVNDAADQELTSMGVVLPDAEYNLNSFESHQFMVQFQDPSNGMGELRFSKNPYDEVVTIYYEESGFDADFSHPFSRMHAQLRHALSKCPDQLHAEHTECIASKTYPAMADVLQHQTDVKTYRDKFTDKLRNYTCGDDSMQTSTPISSSAEFVYDKEVTVDTHMQLEHAKIWAVHNFVSEDECELLMEYGRPRLERAAVVGEDGLGEVSDSRKAQQAAYAISDDTDPLWDLYHRVLNFTNMHSNYDLHIEGQEHFTIIQYNKEDEYMTHCDGICDGSEHNPTARVATAVLYCQAPARGGATTFSKADVYIRPTRGSATFFTYMGPDGLMDTGFTEHSGCPILEGEKWITTAWMRKGVTKDDHADLFDPMGRRVTALAAYDSDLS